MVSPVADTVPNIVMEYVEQKALFTFDHQPTFWKCYVDDIFTASPASIISIYILTP